jgi:hypothetical protein
MQFGHTIGGIDDHLGLRNEQEAKDKFTITSHPAAMIRLVGVPSCVKYGR